MNCPMLRHRSGHKHRGKCDTSKGGTDKVRDRLALVKLKV